MNGDLVARLAWLAEHDRDALVRVLATVDAETLAVARTQAESAVETRRGVDARSDPAP